MSDHVVEIHRRDGQPMGSPISDDVIDEVLAEAVQQVSRAKRQFLVRLGDSEQIVEAVDHKEASAKFFTMWNGSPIEDVPDANYTYISVIEVIGDELFFQTEDALRRSGRTA